MKKMEVINRNIKAIIFDFDGVIIDSFKFHQKKLREFNNTCLTDEEYRCLHDGISFNYSSEKIKDMDWPGYRNYVYTDYVALKINEKIKRIIVNLSKKFKLFIVSSSGEKVIKGLLEKNHILEYFQEVLGYESDLTKVKKFNYLFDKYDFSSDDSIFITDTLGDLIEANEVDLKSIAVDYGFHDRTRLLKGKPIRIISDFEELDNIFIK